MWVKEILGYTSFSRLAPSYNDSWTDRLSHIYTVLILIIFSLIVSGKQLAGDHIQCLVPTEFKPFHNAYVLSHCWTQGTYYLGMNQPIPKSTDEKESSKIHYYQWTPIILVFMALLFKLPYMLWRNLSGFTGFNVENFIALARKTQYEVDDKYGDNIKHASEYLHRWLEFDRKVVTFPQSTEKDFNPKRLRLNFEGGKRWYIVLLYVCIKGMFTVNALAQFIVLDNFLGGWGNTYGTNLIYKLFAGEVWRESPLFPLQTLCDFKIREMTNVLDYTIQCVLPINLFNEKIFMYLWFWLLFVIVMSCISFAKLATLFMFRKKRIAYVVDYMRQINVLYGERDKNLCKKFILDYLRGDGILVLLMLEKNCSPVVATDVLEQLWFSYRNRSNSDTEQATF